MYKMLDRFTINGEPALIAHCTNCGHEVNLTKIVQYIPGFGYVLNADGLSSQMTILEIIDRDSSCCETPNHWFDDVVWG